jgi:subtilisin family serine protease
VRIAVLDTGVDILHPDISHEYENGRIKYHDFTSGSVDIEDLDGHGTHSVSLVAKFAPNAEIYVGRVFRRSVAQRGSAEVVTRVSVV